MSGEVVTVDHVGYVVTDMNEAVRFFIDVLGFEDSLRRGEISFDNSDRMTRLFGVHPGSKARYTFVHIGSSRVELLEWTAPDRSELQPLNSDLGGRHLALGVRNIEGVIATLSAQPGVSVRERNDLGFYYVSTPFGLEIQLIPVK